MLPDCWERSCSNRGLYLRSFSMRPSLKNVYVLAVLSLLPAVPAWADAPLYSTPQQGLLLLRNGQLLEGKITPTGDRFYVELASGKVWVKSVDVEVHCRTLDEGYWLKRSAMPLGVVQSHLDLAQWCIQHMLLGHAADELRDALRIDPQHPRIELLERRLKLAQQKAPATVVEAAPQSAPSADDLDRLVRGMPAGAVEIFTTSIQPLLVNNCTSAGCHGPAAEKEPRFVRVAPGRTTKRLTQRNLHTALTLVNREKPLESPLLTVPARPTDCPRPPCSSICNRPAIASCWPGCSRYPRRRRRRSPQPSPAPCRRSCRPCPLWAFSVRASTRHCRSVRRRPTSPWKKTTTKLHLFRFASGQGRFLLAVLLSAEKSPAGSGPRTPSTRRSSIEDSFRGGRSSFGSAATLVISRS